MDIQKLKEDVRRSGGMHIPPNLSPTIPKTFPQGFIDEIKSRVYLDDPDGSQMENLLDCMRGIYKDVRTFGPDLSEEERKTVSQFGKLLREASDLWWGSPALQRLAPGGEAGSPIHVLEKGIDATEWVTVAFKPKPFQKRTVIRKVLFYWTAIGLALPKSAVTDKITGTRSQPYILCEIMLRAVFGEVPDDFSTMYESIVSKTLSDLKRD